ncbi:hypothetical protein MAPG_06045 [Magnaporthiopsis poae ATCC 64411]|uniref:Uncharacterized protein n=1 Tax=Magnaporthiopsis poae (strain ATCC 64411 / 73-15) TaxID=644358 RepID=A0A0C4E101_MAGP6|nr:hypothetical protein MAPG_06045 [Magnaporthiopsis poae ATCC 64411]
MDSDLRKPHMAVRHRPHLFGRLLHVLALLLLGLTFFLFILVCISGTWIQKEDKKWRLAMANFSMVQFDGIVPKPNTKDEYNVKMHLTLAAFGWEYLNATKKEMQAGIVYQGFAQTLKFPDHLRDVAKRLDLPSSDYDCLHPNTGRCDNPFFNKFRDIKEMTFVTWVQWVIVLLGLIFLVVVFVKDVLITFKKSWMKCHCCFLSSLCPNPKGSVEENATLPPSFWDGLRLYWYGTGFVYMFIVSLILTIRANAIVDELKKKNVPEPDERRVLCSSGSRRLHVRRRRVHGRQQALQPRTREAGACRGQVGRSVPEQQQQQPAAGRRPTLGETGGLDPHISEPLPHPGHASGFHDVNIGSVPPTYAGKAGENPYEKS